MFNYPIPFFVVSIVVLWFSARLGVRWGRRRPLRDDEREDYGFVQAAALTLLGLIIGFSFSMATGRYDQRRNYEEAEANAIGTEFVRVGILPAPDAVRVRAMLREYTDLRISFYETRSTTHLQQINADTSQLQTEMWSAVQAPVVAQPTAVTALALSGMNDVLNSQGYTQAAWWNRIPTSAWYLMLAIAIGCNLTMGYGGRTAKTRSGVLLMLPVFVAIAFLLIADIDSPRWGLIHVRPENLESLSQSLAKQ
ncbi:MAG: hypothetical protein WA419_10255 [Silvibacterium sp.]